MIECGSDVIFTRCIIMFVPLSSDVIRASIQAGTAVMNCGVNSQSGLFECRQTEQPLHCWLVHPEQGSPQEELPQKRVPKVVALQRVDVPAVEQQK